MISMFYNLCHPKGVTNSPLAGAKPLNPDRGDMIIEIPSGIFIKTPSGMTY